MKQLNAVQPAGESANETVIYPLGDQAAVVEWTSRLEGPNERLPLLLASRLLKRSMPGMSEWVIGFQSLTVYYDPYVLWNDIRKAEGREQDDFHAYAYVQAFLQELLTGLEAGDEYGQSVRTVEIPVCYGGCFGPDLEHVAAYHGLTPDALVAAHTSPLYRVRMIGFAPGFPYLAGLPESLATPRKASPRAEVPAGSVGIGGGQTGVYPIAAPGGWQLIGRTPLPLFRPDQHPPSLLEPGDSVRFYAVDEQAYNRLAAEGASGA